MEQGRNKGQKVPRKGWDEMSSAEQGELPPGARLYVVGDRVTLPDGTKRALVTLCGDDEQTPAGWVSCVAKDGRETLIAEFKTR